MAQPLTPTQSIVIENTDITLAEFWEAYTSSHDDERQRAELFLVGVLDATEGVSWCDYKTYKTLTLIERLYGELKKLRAQRANERAARTIGQVLSTHFPCRSRN